MRDEEYDQDDDPMRGFIFGCSVGLWLWFLGYFVWTWVIA